MSALEKLRKQFKKATQKESELWLEEVPAWMGDKDGQVTTGIAGMVYVRTVEGQLLEVFNNTAPAEYNLLVKIGRRKDQPDLWQVIGRREVWDVPGTSSVVHHHEQHEFMAPDMLMLDRRQISQLSVLVRDAAAFTVQVIGAFVHTVNGMIEISSQVVDLSSYVPSTGALFVNIEADDSGTLSVNEGENFGSPLIASVSYIPVPDPGKYLIATILLYEGQETLLDEYIRVPMPLNANPGDYSQSDHDHSTLYLEEAVVPSDADISNPPTEAQLITAIGSPDLVTGKKGYVIDDNGAQNNTYLALAIGGHWWLTPLAMAVLATPSVTVDSTATVATATGRWFGRASIAVQDEIVILAYREGSAHDVNDGELHIKFSDDYGATWSAEDTYLDGTAVTNFPMNPTLGAGQDAGEPQLYIAPNGDLLIHMWRVDYGVSQGGTYQSRSTDGGRTWSTPALIDFGGIASDTDTFSTDDYFVLDGVIYAGARTHDADQSPSESMLIKSEDNGVTWEKVSTICANTEGAGGTGAWEVGLEYIGDDTIIAELRMVDLTRAYQRISTDLGATWGTLTEVTSTIGIAARQRLYTRSHLKGADGWWKDSVLIMTGFVHQTPGSSTSRRNAIWISQDKGDTWSTPFYIDTTSEDAGYGDIFWNPLTSQFVVISYKGTLAEADLKQYNLTLGGV
jgi:hypothetical protein